MKKYLFLTLVLSSANVSAAWVAQYNTCGVKSSVETSCANSASSGGYDWVVSSLGPETCSGTHRWECRFWIEPECSEGQYYDTNTNQCQDFDQQCTSPQIQIGLQCVDILDCGDGQYAIDADGQSCDFPPESCPAGQYYHLGTCYLPDDVPDPEPDPDPNDPDPSDPNHPDHPNYIDPESPEHPDHPDYDGPSDPNHPDHPWYEPPQSPEFDDSRIVNRLDQINQKATDRNAKLDQANEHLGEANEHLESIDESLKKEGDPLPDHTVSDSGATTFSEVNQEFVNRLNNSPVVSSFSNAANVISLEASACPPFSIDFPWPIDATISTIMHCELMDTIRLPLSLIMQAVFSFTAFRIFASA